MHDPIDYGALVEQLQHQGFTQKQVADRLGIDQATVSRLRSRALSDPRASVAMRLIDAVGGSVHLPAGNGTPPTAAPAAQAA